MTQPGEQEEQAPGESPRPEQRILNMTPHGKSASSVEAVLRHRIDELARAIGDKDLDRLMAFYSSEVVAFDIRPPLETRGAESYRQNFEQWFASFEGSISFELKNLRVAPGESTAFCHYLSLIVGAKPAGQKVGYWVRGTTCFERRDGEWLVTHEHISMPSSK